MVVNCKSKGQHTYNSEKAPFSHYHLERKKMQEIGEKKNSSNGRPNHILAVARVSLWLESAKSYQNNKSILIQKHVVGTKTIIYLLRMLN